MGEFIDKAKGRIKQAVGSVTGDKGKQAEGYVDEAKGKIKEKVEDVKHAFRRDKPTDKKDV